MGALCTVRKVDPVGRILIPSKIRSMHNINTDDYMELYQDGAHIVLKKYIPRCVFCGGTERVETCKTKFICHECMDNLKKSSNR